MVGVLPVEQVVPGVAAAGGLKEVLPVRGTLQNAHIAEVIGKDQIRRRKFVGCCQTFVAHERKVIAIVLDIELESDAYLVQVAQANRCPSGFFGATKQGEKQSGQHGDKCYDYQELNQCECGADFEPGLRREIAQRSL